MHSPARIHADHEWDNKEGVVAPYASFSSADATATLIASSTFFAAEHLCAQRSAKFQIFSDDCLCRNRFSMMCTAEVSINIRECILGSGVLK